MVSMILIGAGVALMMFDVTRQARRVPAPRHREETR